MHFWKLSEMKNKVISNFIFLGKNYLKQSNKADEDGEIIKLL